MRMTEVARIKNYFCIFIASIICIIIGFAAIGPTIESVPCPKGFYPRDESMLCSTCTYTLSEACLACTGPFQCEECSIGHYLDAGKCFSCQQSFKGCLECGKSGCTQCQDGWYLERGQCKRCIDIDGCDMD